MIKYGGELIIDGGADDDNNLPTCLLGKLKYIFIGKTEWFFGLSMGFWVSSCKFFWN